MPPEIIIKKFTQAGWTVANKSTGDVCGDCQRKTVASHIDIAKKALTQAAAPFVAVNGSGESMHFSELMALALKLPTEQMRQLVKALHEALPKPTYKRKIVAPPPPESDDQYAQWLEQEESRTRGEAA